MQWNFDELLEDESAKKKAKAATVNGNMPILQSLAKKYNIIPEGVCGSCGESIDSLIMQWFNFAKEEGLLNPKK